MRMTQIDSNSESNTLTNDEIINWMSCTIKHHKKQPLFKKTKL